METIGTAHTLYAKGFRFSSRHPQVRLGNAAFSNPGEPLLVNTGNTELSRPKGAFYVLEHYVALEFLFAWQTDDQVWEKTDHNFLLTTAR